MSGKVAHRVGPHSKPNGLAKLDHRTREAKFMAEVRAQLLAHVGGRPTPPQVALIERCAWLSLHVAQLDARAVDRGEGLSERDARAYLAWSGALTRTLKALGLGAPAAEKGPSLADYYREMDAAPPEPVPEDEPAPSGAAVAAQGQDAAAPDDGAMPGIAPVARPQAAGEA